MHRCVPCPRLPTILDCHHRGALAPETEANSTMQQHSVIFQTPGLIDLNTVRFMGVSVKENDSPIGYFGTGLKYAIAVALREGQKITLYRGREPYMFTARETVIRGRAFPTIYMNEEPLGITAELGKNWKLWMAFRELWSNTKDEGGSVHKMATPEDGLTTIVVEGGAFARVSSEREKYVQESASGELIESSRDLEVWRKDTQRTVSLFSPIDGIATNAMPDNYAFYRGIRAWESHKAFLYRYNIMQSMVLSEDRFILSDWSAKRVIANFIARDCLDAAMIARVVCAGKEYVEAELDFGSAAEPSDLFIETVERHYVRANESARRVVRDRKKLGAYMEMKPVGVQQMMVARAKEFLERRNVPIGDYKVRFTEDLGGDEESSILGRAMEAEGEIWLSSRLFRMGTKMLAGTWLEEVYHLKYNLQDYSPKMQNFLLDTIVTLMEEAEGEVL